MRLPLNCLISMLKHLPQHRHGRRRLITRLPLSPIDKMTINLAAILDVDPVLVVNSLPEDTAADEVDENSYVTVEYVPRGLDRISTARVLISGNEVMVNVMGDMMVNDSIVVTYHNVMVQGLTNTTPVDAKLTVTDKLSPDGSAYDNVMITVNPRAVSTVSVRTTPSTVKSGDTLDTVIVTYTAKGMVSDNEITISLPDEWSTPSDVTVESNLPDDAYGFVGMKTVTVTVDEMGVGKYIKVIFEDVTVQELVVGSLADPSQITVTDKITGPIGIDYNEDARVAVNPSSQSRVTLSHRSVTAEDMLKTVTVTYIASDKVVDNEITVNLPDGWEPVYGSSFIKGEPSTDKATTSYVTVRAGSDVTHDVSGNSVTVVAGTMNPGDRIVVTYHNVMVPMMSGSAPMKAQLRVTDKITGSMLPAQITMVLLT